ncbi:MAG: rod shape-determining protein MreC [Lewinellaceae bacterium]|nr:rod shape-determining protein MreC [Lewinellaceae bacterium]
MTFLLVELFCFYIILQYNDRQNAIFTHTMGLVGGNIQEKRSNLLAYTHLKEVSDSLIAENAHLRAQLSDARNIQVPYRDTFFLRELDSLASNDSLRRLMIRPQYEFIAGRVVGNSISGANNWLVINRGSSDNVQPGMGVVTKDGIAGIVRHVTPHFSMAMSLLHRQTKISVVIHRADAPAPSIRDAGNDNTAGRRKEPVRSLGSLIWEGGDPSVMTLKFVQRHFKVKENDLVLTSGYSQIFPKDILVGKVEGTPKEDPENLNSWIIRVKLNQDMATLNHVYIVNDIFYSELDSLNQKAKNE